MEETHEEEEIKELAKIRETLKNITVEEEINLISEDLNKINENLKMLKNRLNTGNTVKA